MIPFPVALRQAWSLNSFPHTTFFPRRLKTAESSDLITQIWHRRNGLTEKNKLVLITQPSLNLSIRSSATPIQHGRGKNRSPHRRKRGRAVCVREGGGVMLLQSPARLYSLLPFPENTHSLLGDPSLLNIWLVSSPLNPSPVLPLSSGLFVHHVSFSYLTINP